MPQAEKSPAPQAATVADCAATECRHNEDQNCTAGEIQLTVNEGRATCATYAPEKPAARP